MQIRRATSVQNQLLQATSAMSENKQLKIHLIAAARPNFMKVAPLWRVLSVASWCEPHIVHTGQHYDANMSEAFFRDLRLPEPHFHLEVGSGSHAEQTGNVMIAYERVVQIHRPDVIIVVGDVNPTVACALVGAKMWIPVIHLEAGLRSRDRRMPEEINRLMTDAIADVLWTPSLDANENLRSEGIPEERIEFVGNIMIDSFMMMRDAIEADDTRTVMGLVAGRYGIVTLHRPANVDSRETLGHLVAELVAVGRELPLVFAIHPRTLKRLVEFDLLSQLKRAAGLRLTEPLGYVQFMNLVCGAAAVITDSGGVQEETTFLGIPCLTLRENTERPITITEGSNRLVTAEKLAAAVGEALLLRRGSGKAPARWDGTTAERCAADLRRRFLTTRRCNAASADVPPPLSSARV
jgi:UDP-N-acetylglucosamine 2-epimerase (non-hydrolysing)